MTQLLQWTLQRQIGQGGFGQVWLATTPDQQEVVLKLVPRDAQADRELLFVNLAGTPNVIPIMETAETADHYILVMPRAERSLRDELLRQGHRLNVNSALPVLQDVATALTALETRSVVHRDLKPENVLLWQGHWCLADFGISRYAEATTSADTQKYSLTAPYAAPEQWQFDRATSRTDVYAFGIMAFELLEGRTPFTGSNWVAYREHHLHTPPPPATQGPIALRQLISDCLQKPQAARPAPNRVLQRLERAATPPSGAANLLQNVNFDLAQQEAAKNAQQAAQQTAEQRRQQLYTAASAQLRQIVEDLQEQIRENAPSAQLMPTGNLLDVRLGRGQLTISTIQPVGNLDGVARGYPVRFDIVATAEIIVRKPRDQWGYEGRGHSLWYCDAKKEGDYRWFETAFADHALLSGPRKSIQPFPSRPDQDALIALSPTMHTHVVAWPFTPIDQGDETEFFERWLGWFARAAEGSLSMPSSMPEGRPQGSWR